MLKKAFSLIELIFVIVVIAIVAAVALPKFLGTKDEATVSTIKQDVSTIISAVQSYHMLNGSIAKFSDAVSLSTKHWSGIDTKTIEYKENTTTCLKMEITDTHLEITILPTAGTTCQKLSDIGVKTESFLLN